MNIFKRSVATICRILLADVRQRICPGCGTKVPPEQLYGPGGVCDECYCTRLLEYGQKAHRETSIDYSQRLKYLVCLADLEVCMWKDPKQQADVYSFCKGGREVIRVYGYERALAFAKGVEYNRAQPHKRSRP